jgi:hypothetical protein
MSQHFLITTIPLAQTDIETITHGEMDTRIWRTAYCINATKNLFLQRLGSRRQKEVLPHSCRSYLFMVLFISSLRLTLMSHSIVS